MKLFCALLAGIQVVAVLYCLTQSMFGNLSSSQYQVLESKYSIVSTTTQNYGPKKPFEDSQISSFNYSLPMSLSNHMIYEDAFELYNLKEAQSCVPSTFGYTSEEAEVVFPYKGYPRCNKKYEGFEIPEIKVDLNAKIFEIDCKNTTHIKYVIGPFGSSNFTSAYNSISEFKIKKYKGPTHLSKNTEFILAKCGKGAKFDTATMWLRKNQKLYKDYLKGRDKTVKPLLIGYLVLDSFSRRHFYQKLPETVKFLNSLNTNSSYEVHDFKLHNIIGDRSVHNIVPVMTDKNYKPKKRKSLDDSDRDHYLWNNLADKGFITLVGTEACDRKFPLYFGDKVEAHHIIRQFYCAAQKIGGFTYKKSATDKQRCIGPHMSHVYGLNYIQQFVENYPDAKKWFYSHFDAAHEATGQHAETLDLDLRDFLQKLLTYTKQTHNVALFINADHGMRFGDWHKTSSAFQEHKLPALFTVTSKELLDMIPNSRSTLLTNTWRLNSKKEIRRTMQYLSNYPNFVEIPQEDEIRNYNLYTEEIDQNRTCEDAKIPPWYCGCFNIQTVDLKYIEKQNTEMFNMVQYLTDYAIYAMNQNIYGNADYKPESACQKIELLKIENIYLFSYDKITEYINIRFSVTNKKNSAFTALFLISPKPLNSLKIYKEHFHAGTLQSFKYRGFNTYFGIITINRIDSYEGPCEDYAVSKGLKPDTCFCDEDF